MAVKTTRCRDVGRLSYTAPLTLIALAMVAGCVSTAIPAAASTADERMNGIGMPIIFIFFLVVALVVLWKHLIDAFNASQEFPVIFVCFLSSIISMFLSVFLLFTPSYTYGLVTFVLSASLGCLCSSHAVMSHIDALFYVYFAWLLILIGVPKPFNSGVIDSLRSTACEEMYGSFSSSMCVGGWLAVAVIIACLLISLTFLSFMLLTAMMFGVDKSIGLGVRVMEWVERHDFRVRSATNTGGEGVYTNMEGDAGKELQAPLMSTGNDGDGKERRSSSGTHYHRV